MVRGGEAGQALALVLVVLAVAGVVVLLAGRLSGLAVDAARARTAADAAALAGAGGGRPAADAAARANGGRLVGYSRATRGVWVRVQVGRATAAAAARVEAARPPRSPSGVPPAAR